MKTPSRLVILGLISCSLAACVSPSVVGALRSAPERTPAESQSASDSAHQAAIQDVIQRANAEQEQAIASRDSSPMRDTSTDGYYRDMVRINQDLLDSGVTSIRLVGIEWGSITVTGDTAQATTWETWATTTADAATTQSRDRNTYRLVREGSDWKVQSDDHPDEIRQPFPRGPVV